MWQSMINHPRLPLLLSLLALAVALASHVGLLPSLNSPTLDGTSGSSFQTSTQQTSRPYTSAMVQGNFSTLIADVAEKLAPAVVNIDVTVQKETPPPAFGGSDIFRYFFGDAAPPPPQAYQQQGQGSGVIYNAEKGYIITNHHVVGGATEIVVTLNNHTKLPAKLIGSDTLTDLAVIQVLPTKTTRLQAAPLAEESSIRPGDWAIAIGSPLGFDHSVTLGIVSALSRSVPDLNKEVAFIQTDTAINPGNSGGPLVNLAGEVMGINTAISGRAQNIGFSIPSGTVHHVVDTLIAEGRVKRAYVGVSLTPLDTALKEALGASSTTTGVVIAQVQPGSPAEKAGLQQGDILQRINGIAVTSAKDVQDVIRKHPVGSQFKVLVLRQGNLVACTVQSKIMEESTS
jgi:S1-C subfamily serine protease